MDASPVAGEQAGGSPRTSAFSDEPPPPVGCTQINAVFAACRVAEATAAAPGGAVKVIDANEAMIHESAADAQCTMTGTACAYPVQLKKVWVEDGAASGWRVMRDFQKEAGGQ